MSKIVPLNSHWEYRDAAQTLDWYLRHIHLPGAPPLSPQDEREFQELKQRVLAYKTNPTSPNIINHVKGNAFKYSHPNTREDETENK